MSIIPQELLRKISAKCQESSKHISSSDVPNQRFRQLMRVTPTDDRPKEKGVFSLIEEEDEREDDDGAASALCAQPLFSPPPPSSSDQDEEGCAVVAPYAPGSYLTSGFSSQGAAPYANFAMDIEALFERMASSMIMMCSSEETETTLFLDNPSSVFFGSKITIREFSTAPKAFNIEIAALSAAAIASLEAGKQDLLAAFQNGKFNFSVHRIDTHVQSEDRPVLHRKDDSDHQDQQERQGGRER